MSIFESPPVADKVGSFPVAAFAKVNSLTAEPVAVKSASSFPLVSKIEVPILGLVKVLFVKVCVPVRVTSPLPKPVSKTPVLVATPSKYTILCDLSSVAKVTVAPEPDAAFNCTVSAFVVAF